jgi:6-phosphogluconolactonase
MAGYCQVMTTDTQELALFAFDDRAGAENALGTALAASVKAALEEGRRARIALSGGSSPAPAYAKFAAMELDWSSVDIALVDDRWVDLDSVGSNEAMVREAFKDAKGVTIFGMKTPHTTPFEAQATLDPTYAALTPFDAIVLGMGPDAHTASWFPGSPQLAQCLNANAPETVMGVDASAAPVSGAYPLRMTLTLPPIAQAEQVILLLYGDDKKQVLVNALNTPVMQAPIKAALEACDDRLVVFWAS